MLSLPYYFLIGTETSAYSWPTSRTRNILDIFIGVLRSDPFILESGSICVIKYGGVTKVAKPLVDICSFDPNELDFSAGSGLGLGLALLAEKINMDETQAPDRRKIKPTIVISVEDEPADDFERYLLQIKSINTINRMAFVTEGISAKTIKKLKDSDFKIFKCTEVSEDSVRTAVNESFDWIEDDPVQ